jgi:hypothetical protein
LPLARLLYDWAWAERDSPNTNTATHAREAVQLCRTCLKVREQTLKPNDKLLADTKRFLGAALVTQAVVDRSLMPPDRVARLTETEPLLLPGADTLKPGGPDSLARRRPIEWLNRLYAAWDAAAPNTGKSNEATRWQRKLAEFEP